MFARPLTARAAQEACPYGTFASTSRRTIGDLTQSRLPMNKRNTYQNIIAMDAKSSSDAAT